MGADSWMDEVGLTAVVQIVLEGIWRGLAEDRGLGELRCNLYSTVEKEIGMNVPGRRDAALEVQL